MDKFPMTKEEIERLLIAELQTFSNCKKTSRVVVIPVEDHADLTTWTVS